MKSLNPYLRPPGFPAWLEVQFNGTKTITEIDVVTVQNNYMAPVEPTSTMTFTSYGLTSYDVQYWTGTTWVTIPGGSVSSNNLVWRKFTFSAISTTKIRVMGYASGDGWGRLTELEAWTSASPAPRYNVALGATATASSAATSGWGASGVVNGDRKSLNWGNGGGWADAAPVNSFPDWLQVDFGTTKTLDEIDVFTLQDNWGGSTEPTQAMTFSQWGVTAYEVQYWDGAAWVTVNGGNITGNNKIWRRFTFAPVNTTKIRVLTHAAADGYSRLTEIEAYEPPADDWTPAARLDPMNATGGGGENPLSRNFNWSIPLGQLPGRAGLDLGLSLAYNSLVWTKSGSYIAFDEDHGFPSPGFRLGFPVLQLRPNVFMGQPAYILLMPDGSRVELRQAGPAANLYQAVNSSYLVFNTSTMKLQTSDGMQLSYALQGGDLQCTGIRDRNGNYITINYTSFGRVDTVVDTLNRTIKFNYDSNNFLTSITQTWTGNVPHTWASFEYRNPDLTISTNFPGLTTLGTQNGASLKVLSRVILADNSRYEFDYTSWRQVWKISRIAKDGVTLLNYRSYNLPADNTIAQTECPRFTLRRDWAKYWNRDSSGVEQEAITSFIEPIAASWTMPAPDGSTQSGIMCQVTFPDGTSQKIYSHAGSEKALPLLTETYDSTATLQRQIMTSWTSDPIIPGPWNPRVSEVNTYDPQGNRKRVRISYTQISLPDTTSCSFPQDVFEYQADGTTVLRSTRTTYNTNSAYTTRRIVGLVSEQAVYAGDVNNGGVLASKVGYQYDETGSIQGSDAPVQHDNTNYGSSFVVGRGNLSSMKRYNVDNLAQFTTTSSKYNTAGAIVSTTDASSHLTTIDYSDSFSVGVSWATLAYPTKVSDADGYYSTFKYNFDLGAVTYRQTPQPNYDGLPSGQPQHPGPEQTITYDSVGRMDQITSLVNNAYTRYIYGPNYVRTYSTVNSVADEAHSLQIFDGAGRVIASATNHPKADSNNRYSAQLTVYDAMGRAVKESNPTETSITIPQPAAPIGPYNWVALGDDVNYGWVYTQQTYDWKGRPLVTTNQDGTTKTVSYTGCGCAGGEVVTVTDEGTIDNGTAKRRQQKLHSDVLGRSIKTEVLNWQGGSVYSATVTTYNVRDQATEVRQYASAEGAATYQTTTMGYDGYGRLQSRHVPEQDPNTFTTWTYNADDTVNTITDARGAVTTYSYAGTNRHLVKQITSTLSGSPTITTSFTYDAVGNRQLMSDGSGSVSYSYDQLSQLTSEVRTFTGFGSFSLSYSYNRAGELTSITDPFGAQVGYNYDNAGRLSAVTGANFASVSSYASNLEYRASGALKSLTYGNSNTLAVGYDVNLRVSSYAIPGVMEKGYEYYNDGRLKFTHDQLVTNSKFDRLYQHDHTGRVVKALSGDEARGGPASNDRPYNETLTYDALGHLTSHEIRNWDHTTADNQTYTNNRRQYWSYDPDGRVLSGITDYQYDAAGRVSSFGANTDKTDQQFDGDGQRLIATQQSFDPQTNQWSTDDLTYYIRSSVIGEVISEINAIGTKERTFVHAAGNVLAIQYAGGGTNTVLWQYYDASGASNRSVDTSGISYGGGPEMDPLGANAGSVKPPSWPAPSSAGKLEPYYGIPELNSPFRGCVADYVPVDCNTAVHFWG